MIKIDLCEDSPFVETLEGAEMAFLVTISQEGQDNIVERLMPEDRLVPLAWETSVAVRSAFGRSVNNYQVREWILDEVGSYEIHCCTRRGAERTFFLHVGKKGLEQTTLTIGAASTRCAWVVGDEVFTPEGGLGLQIVIPDEFASTQENHPVAATVESALDRLLSSLPPLSPETPLTEESYRAIFEFTEVLKEEPSQASDETPKSRYDRLKDDED